MKPVTFCGTSLGDGNTVCISCEGRPWSGSCYTMLPSVLGAGRSQIPLATMSASMGGNVR